MSFAALIFLFGALAVAGPLIAHLLAKPRFKRIPFTMLRFLQTGHKETQSRRSLRDLLILLFRCLIIVLIAMLFAGPRWLTDESGDDSTSIYYLGLDNSASMAYEDSGGSYFDRMIESSLEYIRSADDAGLFNIYGFASGQWTKNLTKSLAVAHVKRLKIAFNAAKVEEFLSEIRQGGKQSKDGDEIWVLIVSDFTPKTMHQFIDAEEAMAIEKIDYNWIASIEPVNNAAITEAHISGFADGKLGIDVTIVNYSGLKQIRTLTAKTDDADSSPVDVELAANQHRNYSVGVNIDTSQMQDVFLPIELSLSGGDGLKYDDKYYAAVYVPQQETVNVLLLGKNNAEMFLLKTAADTISSMGYYETINVRSMTADNFDLSVLSWADIIMCSSMVAPLASAAEDLKTFVSKGGKLIFFATPRLNDKVANKLYESDILPAGPSKYIKKRAFIEPAPCDDRTLDSESRDSIIKALHNYKLDNVTVTGYFQCRQAPEAVCDWRFANEQGFVFSKCLDSGICMFINTSADDSMSSLTKSSGCIAFCRYLLGSKEQIQEHIFASDEQVVLPASEMEIEFAKTKREIWVELCDGSKATALVADSFLVPPGSGGIGWIKTLAKPLRYAGVNLPDGETDMTAANQQAVANLMERVFSPQVTQTLATAGISTDKNYKHLWKLFAWTIIALVITEAFLVNRMKR